ncbi:zinc-dependent peptidase [Roseibacillus ishigakijimensis]|uniref:Zinc-dependent peptidase n=1 Tax=Roseibacillus ishigakijimensis TaxID=454146 RepID=A0A934VMK8_9BACT|nr:M90 family metallopeptidase [Roseibacillus ishigakijimensis]MBK1834196.1 zinc-dependent peptidase [Roseibacillus ishigakijimensis]
MDGITLILLITVAAVAFGYWRWRVRRERRRVLATTGFSEQEQHWVRSNWELWDHLPEGLRTEVEGLAKVFLDEKVFEACGGLPTVTEEMRTVVAAQACLLWANQRGAPYPALRAILMYPDAYRVKDEYGMESVRLGESWSRGTVVLAWKSVRGGGCNDEDGHNLVLHEFAHQLDTVNGAADGFPELPDNADFSSWPEVFSREFEQLCADVERGKRTVMDSYGTTNEAEFFAVATETFFEKPSQMAEEHPALYGLLRDFFATDPVRWP